MISKLLSVIVPIYNTEKFLRQCIDSILGQTYKELEIILVDDGSTDLSRDIVDDYGRRYDQIQVIHKKNGGLLSARHAGCFAAKGEYITFVDSDDWIAKNMYRSLMEKVNRYNVDLVTSGCCRYLSEEINSITYDRYIKTGVYDKNQIQNEIMPIMMWDKRSHLWSLDPSTCLKIYRRNLLLPILEKLKDQKFYYGEDSAITYSYILKSDRVCCTNDVFYYHRQRQAYQIAPYFFSDSFYQNLNDLYYFLYDEFKKHDLREILIKQLDIFFLTSAKYKLRKYKTFIKDEYYLFPFDLVKRNSKLVIYGAGRVGRDYIQQLENLMIYTLVLWVDQNYKEMEKRIVAPETIDSVEFDYIVIAVAQENSNKAIQNWLKGRGIPDTKIVSRIIKCV